LSRIREFGDSHDRRQWRGLQQDREFVDERRQARFQHLRQRNPQRDAPRRHAERNRRFILTGRDDPEIAAQDFGRVRPTVQAERQRGGQHRSTAQSDQR
jgi:hypothetical protein